MPLVLRIAVSFALPFVAAVALTGCNGPAATGTLAQQAIDQDDSCVTDSPNVAQRCTVGRKIAFLPNRWGNQQLPLIFIANNCDLRYQVALTEGGAVCIFKPLRPEQRSPAASSASQ